MARKIRYQFIDPELSEDQKRYIAILDRAVARCMASGVSAYEVRNSVLLTTDRICRHQGGDFSRGLADPVRLAEIDGEVA